MEKNLDEFINDWQVDVKNAYATHSSGVGFKYIPNGEEGPRLEILNMPQWFQKELSAGKSLQECNKYLGQLRSQFVIIHRELMPSLSKSVSVSKGVGYER